MSLSINIIRLEDNINMYRVQINKLDNLKRNKNKK